MAENSKIAWTDHTFNPWIGCSKVHTGCKNCYAENMMANRYKRVVWGDGGTRSRTSEANWKKPLKWNLDADAVQQYYSANYSTDPERPRVFCASLADVFEDREELAPWRRDLFGLIDECQNLDFLLLTKRPEYVLEMWPGREDFPESVTGRRKKIRDNVWLGTSISDQSTADKYVPLLLKNRDLVPVLFLSLEPMLGRVELPRLCPYCKYLNTNYVINCGECDRAIDMPEILPDWVIIGCESNGKNVGRLGEFETEAEWLDGAIDVVRQCREAGVPCFVKQIPVNGKVSHDPDEWPEELRVREKPSVDGVLNG